MPRLYWTRTRIIRAIHQWALVYGEPPRAAHWSRGGVWWPDQKTVRERFGSWNAAIRAAGYTQPLPGLWRRCQTCQGTGLKGATR